MAKPKFLPAKLDNVIAKTSKGKIDLQQAIKLKRLGYTYAAIAKVYNCSSQAVHELLHKHNDASIINENILTQFIDSKPTILENIQYKLLELINVKMGSDAINTTPIRDLMLMYCQIYDKTRLEKHQSTENVAVISDAIANITANRLKKSKPKP